MVAKSAFTKVGALMCLLVFETTSMKSRFKAAWLTPPANCSRA